MENAQEKWLQKDLNNITPESWFQYDAGFRGDICRLPTHWVVSIQKDVHNIARTRTCSEH